MTDTSAEAIRRAALEEAAKIAVTGNGDRRVRMSIADEILATLPTPAGEDLENCVGLPVANETPRSSTIAPEDQRPVNLERLLEQLKLVESGSEHHPWDAEMLCGTAAKTIERLLTALENIALLDEAEGHLLSRADALSAVAIATNVLGKHPSEVFAQREAVEERGADCSPLKEQRSSPNLPVPPQPQGWPTEEEIARVLRQFLEKEIGGGSITLETRPIMTIPEFVIPSVARAVLSLFPARAEGEGWKPYQIGTPVRISETFRFRGDWQGWSGFIAGVRADTITGRVSYEVNDHWPPKPGNTDGFYHDDLTPLSATPAREG